MWELIYWVTTLGILAWSLFTPSGRSAWGWFFNNFVAAALKEATPLLNELAPSLVVIMQGFANTFKQFGPAMRDTVAGPVGDLAADNFAVATANLTLMGESTPDNAVDQATAAFKQAYGFGFSSAAVTAAFEACFPEKLNVLNALGPAFAGMAGFEEVSKKVLEPLYENAFGQALKYYFKSQFKPEFADEGDAVQWHSRRLLSETDLREVFKYSGLKAKYEDAYVKSAYRAIQPRALVSLIQDVVFPTDDMTALLQFAGIRDEDIARMLPLMEENSVKNVRGQYLSALVRGAEMGTLDDATLDSHLDSLNFSDKAKNYVHLTVSIKRLEQLAELYRKSVTALYETNQLTDAQYVPALEAIGINQADAEAHFAIDSARLKGRQLLAAEKEAAREQARITSVAVQTARTGYLSGGIGDAQFGADIAASGLPLSMVPGAIELAVAQRRARRTNVYGRLLDSPAALLLVEKVRATREQLIKKLITVDMARDALKSYELPDANINALLAEWAAQALKTVMVP